jgi:hypothetical protein
LSRAARTSSSGISFLGFSINDLSQCSKINWSKFCRKSAICRKH